MRFTGFPVAAFEFYAGLRADNSKADWAAHRPVYEDSVRGRRAHRRVPRRRHPDGFRGAAGFAEPTLTTDQRWWYSGALKK